MRKLFAFLMAFAFLLAVVLFSFNVKGADIGKGVTITGTSAFVQIQTASTPARWVQLVAPTGNAGTVYWGACNSTTSTANTMAAGSGQFFPPMTNSGYDLAQICVQATSPDTIRINWAQ